MTFEVKDSGQRQQFESGMVRDTTEGKINYLLIRPGPMFERWAAHLSTAAAKYDNTRKPGEPRNWQLASGPAELERFQESAARHFEQWLAGNEDEDHAAGVFFNINGAEYVKAKRRAKDIVLKKFEEEATRAKFAESGIVLPHRRPYPLTAEQEQKLKAHDLYAVAYRPPRQGEQYLFEGGELVTALSTGYQVNRLIVSPRTGPYTP